MEKIDIPTVLRAVAHIQSRGKPSGDQAIRYRGIELTSDYDGYTAILSNADVSLTVMFHNQYNLKFRHRPALDDFYETIEKIARETSKPR